MKLRRYISLILLCVYLFAAAGTAYASLSCECVAMKAVTMHACCHHCDHTDDGARQAMNAPCCGNHHSTEINLYTGSGSDNDRSVRCAVNVLPPQLSPECPQAIDPLEVCETLVEERCFFPHEAFVFCAGLRAPPVMA